jgi:hypothetical protein
MRTRKVKTIFEYLEVVAKLQGMGKLWFRGVASADYKLVPGLIWRDHMKQEGSYVHNFLVAFRAYVDYVPESAWDVYGLMQHHGLPTRLLDWTPSPLHALFFALTQDTALDDDRVVWVLPPHNINEQTLGVAEVFCPGALASRDVVTPNGVVNLDAYLPEALDSLDHHALPEHPIAIEARRTDRRVRAQMGCFTVHGSSKEPIDAFYKDGIHAPHIAQITLGTKGRRETFLKPLLAWHINEETVYQDLDSLAARIRRENGS